MDMQRLDGALLPPFSIHLMLASLKGLGVSKDVAFTTANASKTIVDVPGAYISARDELRMQQAYVKLTEGHPRRQSLWFELGTKYHCVSFGALGNVWLTSDTVADALTFSSSRQDLHYGANEAQLILSDGQPVGMEMINRAIPEGLLEFTMLRALGCMTTVLRDLTGIETPISYIEHANILGVQDISKSSEGVGEASRIFWGYKNSRHSIVTADDALRTVYEAECQPPLLSDQLIALLTRKITSEALKGESIDISIEHIAEQLRLNKRTLQRRLALESVTARDIVRSARLNAAKMLLRSTPLSQAEISYRLGFADESSFSRAFHGWAQVRPGEFRRSQSIGYTLPLQERRAAS